MGWTNTRKGTSKPTGLTNNTRVKCPKCGTTQFVRSGVASWVCNGCGKRN